MSAHRAWGAALLIGLSACGGPVQAPLQPSAEQIVFGAGPGGARDACFVCHGLDGAGLDGAPRLAGLEAGYLLKQMSDYAGARRADAVMGPIAQRLSDDERRAIAAYYAQLEAPPVRLGPPPPLYHAGDAARGIMPCAECHGIAAQGVGAANPALAGQPAAYTREQLRRWKYALRRNDANDLMGAAARPLTDAEIDALAVYLAGAGR